MNESKAITHAGDAIAQQLPQRQGVNQWSQEEIEVLTNLIAKDCTPVELKLFANVCEKTGLDPFSRQIYAIKRNSRDGARLTIQTSIDGFRAIAEDTGQYAGNDDAVYDGSLTLAEHIAKTGNAKTPPKTATVTVYKIVNGQKCGFTASAAYEQYAQPKSPMWSNMPHTMIAKCAEALALRKAFPKKLSGIYTQDEMDQAETQTQSTDQTNGNGHQTRKQTGPAEKPAKPASEAQIEFISRLMGSHVITPQEKQKITARIDRGMTAKEASGAIEWLQETIEGRKQAADEEGLQVDVEDLDESRVEQITPEEIDALDKDLEAAGI